MSTDKPAPDDQLEDSPGASTATEERRAPLVVIEEEAEGSAADETGEGEEGEEEKPPLKLDVKVDAPSACQRHVTVTIPREDVDRYMADAFDEVMPEASVPGFRPGRACKLVESRYKKDVAEKVKGTLLMDSMTQINDDQKFSPISEPDFDFEAIKLPDDGPMTFEFDIEVRPEFDLPKWEGLKLKRPTREFTEEDTDAHVGRVMERFTDRVETGEPVAANDYVTLDMTFRREGEVVSRVEGISVRVKPKLSFPDANLEGFDKLVVGKNPGDEVQATLKISEDADDEALAGREVEATFAIKAVERSKLSKSKDDLLKAAGLGSEEMLRKLVKSEMDRQLVYHQQQEIRRQITALLTESADWDLPPELLKRQSRRELERAVMELQSAGFSQSDIQAHANELRRSSRANTERALKEHFILERIAEERELDAEPADYDDEIQRIAAQQDDSPRRVRARLESCGQMDALRNQIIERKVLDLITDSATFEDVPYQPKPTDVEAVDFAIAGQEESDIPEAKHGEEPPSKLPQPAERV